MPAQWHNGPDMMSVSGICHSGHRTSNTGFSTSPTLPHSLQGNTIYKCQSVRLTGLLQSINQSINQSKRNISWANQKGAEWHRLVVFMSIVCRAMRALCLAAALRPPADCKRSLGRPRIPGWGQSMTTFSLWTSASTQLGGRQGIGTFDIKSSVRQCSTLEWSSPIKKTKAMLAVQFSKYVYSSTAVW